MRSPHGWLLFGLNILQKKNLKTTTKIEVLSKSKGELHTFCCEYYILFQNSHPYICMCEAKIEHCADMTVLIMRFG